MLCFFFQRPLRSGDGSSEAPDGKLSRRAHDELTQIFAKIGDKDESEEGIRLLHAFRERHPDADLDPFLLKSSQFFKNYIEAGLDKLDEEKRRNTEDEAAASRRIDELAGPSEQGAAAASSEDSDDAFYYMNRLNKVRALYGFPLTADNAANSDGLASPTSAALRELDTPISEDRPFGATMPRSRSFSPNENGSGSQSSSTHGSPGDENREIVNSAVKVIYQITNHISS